MNRRRFADLAEALVPEYSDVATMLLDTDLRIRSVNTAYETLTSRCRAELVGALLFDAFPDNPDDPHANGVATVEASLRAAMLCLGTVVVPIVRYDIADPGDPGVYLPKLWTIANASVHDGSEQLGVLHRVQQITTLDGILTALDRALCVEAQLGQAEHVRLLLALAEAERN